MKKILFVTLFGMTVALKTACFGFVAYDDLSEFQKSKISKSVWDEMTPYFLPEGKVKEKLDQIFLKSRATLNSDNLKKAGFTTGKHQKFSKIVVTKHVDLPGFVFKIYLDDEKHRGESTAQFLLLRRARGADLIRQFIAKHDLSHLFKAPNKWIYLLSEPESKSKKYIYKNFILVEEDMNILSKNENKKAWKSSLVNRAVLKGFYDIIKDVGLVDCVKIDNVPFSVDGKIAFIDTEAHGNYTPNFKRLKKSLPSDMKRYWREISNK